MIDLLSEMGMLECKLSYIPMVLNEKCSKWIESEPVDPTLYKQVVGKLIYLTVTHPNITFVVGIVSQFMQSP